MKRLILITVLVQVRNKESKPKPAIGVGGKYEISGFIAWLFWSLIHLVYLIGYKSKFVVAIEWIFAFFFNKRGTRLIYREKS